MKAASLNHVYRLVWSRLQQAWVAVAETAPAQGKSSVSGSVVAPAVTSTTARHVGALNGSAKRGLLVASTLVAVMTPFASYADTNVVAGVVAGDMTVKDLSDTHTQYTHTANVNIVNFYKFGVQKGHQLDVVMPDSARALYRVIGDSRSEIMGTLNANGSLFLINQNGILFGNGSEVNVGNIVASSLDISNDNFIKGQYNFAVGSIVGNVENYGVIKAKNEGYIVLLGKTVDNSGSLVASNGSVVLGSAQQATLDFFGNGLIKAKLSGDALEANIKNSGAIYADGGFVQMATNARASAINISGIVEANQLVERNGVIRLEGGDNAKVQVSGQLIAKGQNTTGGTIEVTGEQVALMDGALLDASGDKGGGTVLVGGDYQGKNDAVYNARTTYVASGATIKADAIQAGNGGKVIVWADYLTRYYGNISAQGGATKGNGGFVEVSGKQYLAMLGDVNVGAANGIGGTVLFDPENIVLNNTAASAPTNQPNGTPDDAFANNPGANTEVNVTQVNGYSELYLQANNNITVNSALTMKRNGSVRLEANNDIIVNAAITTTGTGSINLKADADNSGAGNLAIGANISGTGGVTLSAATLTRTAGDISAPGAGSRTGNAGNVNVTVAGLANFGSANISAKGRENSFPPAGFNGGTVTINAGSLIMTGNIDTSGSSVVSQNGQIVSFPGGNGGAVTISTSGNATVGNIITGAGAAGTGTNISASNSGAVQISSANGNVEVLSINTQGQRNSNGASVTLTAINGTVTTGAITANSVDSNGDVVTTGATNTNSIFVRAGQDVVQNGNIVTSSTSANAVTLVAGRDYRNNNNDDITTGTNGRWLIYSTAPERNQAGSTVLSKANFEQFGTSYDAVQSNAQQVPSAGNGLIYTTTLLNISPRDNAGLGGLVGTNPALNTMTIVSLNPAAGDEEDLDAVACPVNEDHLGSTPILSSGVKLPDGVNSNCI